jgi:hypothetical protein
MTKCVRQSRNSRICPNLIARPVIRFNTHQHPIPPNSKQLMIREWNRLIINLIRHLVIPSFLIQFSLQPKSLSSLHLLQLLILIAIGII